MQLPNGFTEYLHRTMSEEMVATLTNGLLSKPVVSIRVNRRAIPQPAHQPTDNMGSELSETQVSPQRHAFNQSIERRGGTVLSDPIPWCHEGFYLSERPVFAGDPLWHAGAYYVQEASSMFLAHVIMTLKKSFPPLSLEEEGICLDLCAAPGGKSTLLRSLLPDNWLLVSNEPIRNRCQILAENMAKWGHPNVVVTNAYSNDITQAVGPNTFSIILTDVPCSGEGMMRKETEAVAQWSPQLVTDCATLQRSIVRDIWPSLKPGGILIYSTCTFNPEEDENNVEWISRELGANVLTLPVNPEWGILGDLRKDVKVPLPCYHFLPGKVRGEGFFCAVLQKHTDIGSEADSTISADFIENTGCRKEGKKKGKGKQAIASLTLADRLRNQLPTLPIDILDRPEPDRKTGKMPPIAACIELDLHDAFCYLRGESLTLPSDTPRGIVQVCFRGRRLGLMKNLGTRANNLYPKEWRIRSNNIMATCII